MFGLCVDDGGDDDDDDDDKAGSFSAVSQCTERREPNRYVKFATEYLHQRPTEFNALDFPVILWGNLLVIL
jgi:hypothetical protein